MRVTVPCRPLRRRCGRLLSCAALIAAACGPPPPSSPPGAAAKADDPAPARSALALPLPALPTDDVLQVCGPDRWRATIARVSRDASGTVLRELDGTPRSYDAPRTTACLDPHDRVEPFNLRFNYGVWGHQLVIGGAVQLSPSGEPFDDHWVAVFEGVFNFSASCWQLDFHADDRALIAVGRDEQRLPLFDGALDVAASDAALVVADDIRPQWFWSNAGPPEAGWAPLSSGLHRVLVVVNENQGNAELNVSRATADRVRCR